MDNELYYCRICGLKFDIPIRDERGTADYSICACCGAEFGLDDETIDQVKNYRQQ